MRPPSGRPPELVPLLPPLSSPKSPVPATAGRDGAAEDGGGPYRAHAQRHSHRAILGGMLPARDGFPHDSSPKATYVPRAPALVRETNLSPGDFVYPMFFNAALEEAWPIGRCPASISIP